MDFEMVIFFAFAEIVMDEEASDGLKSLRIDALKKVQRSLNHYHHLGYIPELTRAIAEKKCRMIKEATSKSEMEKFLQPRCPRYDGEKFIEDPYIVPEEELICWSYASLRFPLNSIGAARFQEVFKRVFPDGTGNVMRESEADYE
jgi:hypothetical protein